MIHASLSINMCCVLSSDISHLSTRVLLPYLGILCIQFDDTRIVSGSSDKTIKVIQYINDIQVLL